MQQLPPGWVQVDHSNLLLNRVLYSPGGDWAMMDRRGLIGPVSIHNIVATAKQDNFPGYIASIILAGARFPALPRRWADVFVTVSCVGTFFEGTEADLVYAELERLTGER